MIIPMVTTMISVTPPKNPPKNPPRNFAYCSSVSSKNGWPAGYLSQVLGSSLLSPQSFKLLQVNDRRIHLRFLHRKLLFLQATVGIQEETIHVIMTLCYSQPPSSLSLSLSLSPCLGIEEYWLKLSNQCISGLLMHGVCDYATHLYCILTKY